MKKSIKIALLMALMPGFAFAGKTKKAFIEQKLIITPKEQAASKANIAKKLIPAIGIPILFNYCGIYAIKQLILWVIPKFPDIIALMLQQPIPALGSPEEQAIIVRAKLAVENNTPGPKFSSGIRALVIYYIAHRIILSRLEKANFLKFIQEWESNKEHTPKELRYQFDELHSAYKNNGRLDSKKANTLKVRIKRLIEEKTPAKGKLKC